MRVEEMRLDGNAAGGALRDVFAREMTGAVATCTGCGAAGPIGRLLSYGHAMGIILRCPHCDTAVLTLVRTPGWVRLDAAGLALLAIPDGSDPG